MRYFYWLLIIKSCFLMVVLNLDMEYICTAKTLINVVEEGSYYQIKFFAANKTSLKNYFLAEVIEQNLKLTSNCFCGLCCVQMMVRPSQDPLQYFHYTWIPLKLPLISLQLQTKATRFIRMVSSNVLQKLRYKTVCFIILGR